MLELLGLDGAEEFGGLDQEAKVAEILLWCLRDEALWDEGRDIPELQGEHGRPRPEGQIGAVPATTPEGIGEDIDGRHQAIEWARIGNMQEAVPQNLAAGVGQVLRQSADHHPDAVRLIPDCQFHTRDEGLVHLDTEPVADRGNHEGVRVEAHFGSWNRFRGRRIQAGAGEALNIVSSKHRRSALGFPEPSDRLRSVEVPEDVGVLDRRLVRTGEHQGRAKPVGHADHRRKGGLAPDVEGAGTASEDTGQEVRIVDGGDEGKTPAGREAP